MQIAWKKNKRLSQPKTYIFILLRILITDFSQLYICVGPVIIIYSEFSLIEDQDISDSILKLVKNQSLGYLHLPCIYHTKTKCNTETRTRIELAKGQFQRSCKVLRNRNVDLQKNTDNSMYHTSRKRGRKHVQNQC